MTDQNPLVSIIIPTFNRAHLIGETLDSVLAQTYKNWECIVTDDGSTDDTDTVMAMYVANDTRFKYFHRPADKPKGANACRNNGLDKSLGDYIIFFDSDDLMTEDHIAIKIKPLLEGDYDFTITKTKYFNADDGSLERYYNYKEFEITAHNYIVQNINWLTLDVCIKSSIAKSIQFNEILKSGQEFNYYSKLLMKTENCIFIDEYVSLRRKHNESVQNKLLVHRKKPRGSFFSKWETYKDLKPYLSKETKKELLYVCTNIIYREKTFFVNEKFLFFKELYGSFGFSAFNFIPLVILRKYSNRGFYFREKLKNRARKNE